MLTTRKERGPMPAAAQPVLSLRIRIADVRRDADVRM